MRLPRLLPAIPLTVLALMLSSPTAAWAETDDPNLEQTIEPGQAVVHGERVLTEGHVDMGPRFVDGDWTFLIHDDVAKADASAVSVWRYPDETVFHLLDAGELSAPDDPAYAFLGAAAGSTVWVSPQTQNPDVIWIGWNTQDPDVMALIDRGMTLTLRGVQGPGVMAVFLQSGDFGEPQLLWTSQNADPQSVWVDVNTHTHANWTFTEPGVYLVEIEASADLVDGTTVSDTQVVRIAVASDTDPAAALAAAWEDGAADEGTGPDATSPAEDDTDASTPASSGDPLVPILIGAIALVASGLVVAVVVVAVRGSRARRTALAGASSSVSSAPASPGGAADHDAGDTR